MDRSQKQLVMKEELCCKFENGRSEYFRCNGSDYAKSCNGEEEEEEEVLDEKSALDALNREEEETAKTVAAFNRLPRRSLGFISKGRPHRELNKPYIRNVQK